MVCSWNFLRNGNGTEKGNGNETKNEKSKEKGKEKDKKSIGKVQERYWGRIGKALEKHRKSIGEP